LDSSAFSTSKLDPLVSGLLVVTIFFDRQIVPVSASLTTEAGLPATVSFGLVPHVVSMCTGTKMLVFYTRRIVARVENKRSGLRGFPVQVNVYLPVH
jgi:hypothetical protein